MRRGRGAARALLPLILSWWLPVATLLAQNVSALSPLQFGIVIAGTSSSIDPRGTGAMQFDLVGPISVNGGNFTLPTQLTRVGGGGTMPITFCGTCGVYRIANNNPAGGVTFNPANPVLGIAAGDLVHVYLWIGAAVSPGLSQAPGSYTGTVIFTLAPII